MTTQTAHAEPNYMKVFWWLLALTLLEVGIIYSPISRILMVVALILTALIKAALVAINYMHLRFERWTLIVVAILPLLLAVDLLLGLLPDIGHVIF